MPFYVMSGPSLAVTSNGLRSLQLLEDRLTRAQQDHTDNEQTHAGKSAGLETLAQKEPAAQRCAQNAEAAPHGVGHSQIHILDSQREAVKGQADQSQGGDADQAFFEAVGTGQHEVGGHVQSSGSGHKAGGQDEMQRFRIHGNSL